MQCPRCGADNDDARVACWNCFAQLHAPTGGKPRKAETAKAQPAPAVPPQEPMLVAVEPPVAPPPQPVEEQPTEEDSKALDLGEPAAGYFVPGLAEPAPEIEREAEQVKPPAVAAVEEEPEELESPRTPVLDLDAFEKEIEAPGEPEKSEEEA